ncbi:MAG: Sec-independent protein translocase protein TatB [Pseudomonadota bacterium]
MIPQFGFFELILLAALALVVVGPKDLPRLMRSIGQFMGKARALAREFQASFDQMAREAELKEMRAEIEALRNNNPISDMKDAVNEAVAPVRESVAEEQAKLAAAAAGDEGPAATAPDESASSDAPDGAPHKDAVEAGR